MKNNRIRISMLPKQLPAGQIKESIAYITNKRANISRFDSIEDFAIELDETNDQKLAAFEHHSRRLRSLIARKLWSEGAFIGISIIESLLFESSKDPAVANPVDEVFKKIKDFGLHRNGFVLYPLHSFGILDIGLIALRPEARPVYLTPPDSGMSITPQTNDENRLIEFLEAATTQLHIKYKLPIEHLEHFFRSGNLKWLTRNPVLAVRCRVFSGSYYENQFLLLAKLKMAVAFMTMLFAFQKNQKEGTARRFFSSSSINNFSTLDFRHYLVFQAPTGNRRAFSVQRVPMNVSKPELAELSELSIELDPKEWRRRQTMLDVIKDSLAKIEAGYLKNCIGSLKDTTERRVYFKLFNAVNHFRRSFRQSSNAQQNIISLTIGFETLLTDFYAKGVEDRIVRRVGMLIKGKSGVRRMKTAVRELYNARSQYVHNGETEITPDWAACRQAFVHCLINICKRLHKIPRTSGAPIGDIIGD